MSRSRRPKRRGEGSNRCDIRHSGMVPTGRRVARTRWHRPGMTEPGSLPLRNDTKSTYDFALAAQRARAVDKFFRPKRAQGTPGARCTRSPLCKGRKHRGRSHRYPGTPGIPCAMVLTAYVVLSPVTGLFCHRRLRIWNVRARLGRHASAKLDASVGASGPHDFAVRDNISRPRACDRSQIFRPALQSIARSTLPRPPHPAPNVRDDHDTPLSRAGMGKVLKMIWGERKGKYFCKEDST
jgi:hypothetical protein